MFLDRFIVLIFPALSVGFGTYILWIASSTIVQVSKGHYVLDQDAPQGLKARKWFLMIMLVVIFLRSLSMAIELVLQYYKVHDAHELWLIRTPPSFLFLLYNSFLVNYLWKTIDLFTGESSLLLVSTRYSWIFVIIAIFFIDVLYWYESAFEKPNEYWQHAQKCCGALSLGNICMTLYMLYGIQFVVQMLRKSRVANAPRVMTRFLLLSGLVVTSTMLNAGFRAYEWLIPVIELKTEYISIEESATIFVTECLSSWMVIRTLTNRSIFMEDILKKYMLKSRNRVGFPSSFTQGVSVEMNGLVQYSQIHPDTTGISSNVENPLNDIKYGDFVDQSSFLKSSVEFEAFSMHHSQLVPHNMYGSLS